MLKALGTVDEQEALAAVEMTTSPFMEGRTVEYIVDCDGFNGTAKIQGSNDSGDNWTDLVTVTEAVSDRTLRGTVLLYRDMRWNCTDHTAGEADANLRADP